MRVIVVVQARMGSTRLPGKVLEDLGGLPVLSWVVRACRAARLVDDVVVATSTLPGDDPVAGLAAELGVPVVRGSEDDVLSRYVQALEAHPADAVVRITADCPLTDPAVIDAVVGAWRADPTLDYVSTVVVRTLPHGLDVELVTADALRRVAATATDHHRTHVTSGIYTAPDDYAVMGLCFAPDTTDLRITLDTPQDLEALRAIVAARGTGIAERREVVALLRARPELAAINADITQKSLEAG
ncbi:spore coat polysaccharide biosynthesis protein SpsF [Pedococcus dokdonensis]|uniref:Spore coat polysaccharide biosynthesis protein SpsF n=1 Tax=Pedococcus dokdonensis TaxID=443156 RepID=A0A1H0RG97_9MICO|nr:glycosyltransferase family protein [Pedococcus dokdonensis]SDP28593.1 spore coat polysaccharide biosynthesis protein SpsF [Pedococcus dokdonensis]